MRKNISPEGGVEDGEDGDDGEPCFDTNAFTTWLSLPLPRFIFSPTSTIKCSSLLFSVAVVDVAGNRDGLLLLVVVVLMECV